MISEEGTFRQIAHAELSAIRHRIANCCNGGNFRFRLKDSWDGFDARSVRAQTVSSCWRRAPPPQSYTWSSCHIRTSNAHPIPKPSQLLRNGVAPDGFIMPLLGRFANESTDRATCVSLPLLRTARHDRTEVTAAIVDTAGLAPS